MQAFVFYHFRNPKSKNLGILGYILALFLVPIIKFAIPFLRCVIARHDAILNFSLTPMHNLPPFLVIASYLAMTYLRCVVGKSGYILKYFFPTSLHYAPCASLTTKIRNLSLNHLIHSLIIYLFRPLTSDLRHPPTVPSQTPLSPLPGQLLS
jgi:hypothetical protein